MSSGTRRATVALLATAAALGLVGGCTPSATYDGSVAFVAAGDQVARDAEQRLADQGLGSEITVMPRFTTQTFLLTATVTFPADLRGKALADAAGGVRRTLLADRLLKPQQTLLVDSLELTDAALTGSSARWNGDAVGPDLDVEARLWARMTDAVTAGLAVQEVHVWHDDGMPLAVEALDPSDDSAVPGSDLYAAVLDLVDAAEIDPRRLRITTWSQFAVSTVDRPRLGGHTLAALEALHALPFVGAVEVHADETTVTVDATLGKEPGTDEPMPWGAAERSETHEALDAAALPTTGVTVDVSAGADSTPTRVWPPHH